MTSPPLPAVGAPRRRRRTDRPDPTYRLLIALAVVVGILTATSTSIAVYSVVRLTKQQHQIEAGFAQGQRDRLTSIGAFCSAINTNAERANRQNDYLRAIIVDGARQSRVFDDIYRAHGAPPYRERLAQAKDVARGLQGRRIPALDCSGFIRKVKEASKKAGVNVG